MDESSNPPEDADYELVERFYISETMTVPTRIFGGSQRREYLCPECFAQGKHEVMRVSTETRDGFAAGFPEKITVLSCGRCNRRYDAPRIEAVDG